MTEFLLLILVLFVVFLSGLFSGGETGIYQLSRLRVRLGVEQGKRTYRILSKAMQDSSSLLLSMLLGNNVTHYIITSIVTYSLIRHIPIDINKEVLTTIVTAPVLFIFAELIPKNLFYYRTERLMGIFAPFYYLSHKLFTWLGAVKVLRVLSRLFGRLTGSKISDKAIISGYQRHQIQTIFQESREEGVFSSVQNEILNRILVIPTVRVRSVMVPLNAVVMVDINSGRAQLHEILEKYSFSRYPVYEGQRTNVIGYINIFECLTSNEDFTDLRGFVRPIEKLQAERAVPDAIDEMQKKGAKIVLVNRAFADKALGVVTMKDLAEELLGELAEW